MVTSPLFENLNFNQQKKNINLTSGIFNQKSRKASKEEICKIKALSFDLPANHDDSLSPQHLFKIGTTPKGSLVENKTQHSNQTPVTAVSNFSIINTNKKHPDPESGQKSGNETPCFH